MENNKKILCPQCLGSGELMRSKAKTEKNPKGKGFDYKPCILCNGRGNVPKEIAEDFELSLNEDNLDFEDNG